MVEIARSYANADVLQRGARNYALCPFHDDHRPSMLINDRQFYCFGCGEHGDNVAFVSKLCSISPYDAAKAICADFNLLPVGVNASYRQRPVADATEQRKKQDEATIRRQRVNIASKCLALVVRMIDHGLRTPADLERFGELAQVQGECETILELLDSKDTTTQDLGLSLFERWWVA